MFSKNEFVENVLSSQENSKFSKEEHKKLIQGCLNTLTESDQNRLLSDEKLQATFKKSIHRLQESFNPAELEQAVKNFKDVDLSKISSQHSAFSPEIANKISSSKEFKKIDNLGAGISTILATSVLTSETLSLEKQQKLDHIITELLVGALTNKEKKLLQASRTLDENAFEKNPYTKQVEFRKPKPELVIEVGRYALENYDTLSQMDPKELRKEGTAKKNDLLNASQSPKKGKPSISIMTDVETPSNTPPVTPSPLSSSKSKEGRGF